MQFGMPVNGALTPIDLYRFTTGTGVYATTVLPTNSITDLGIGFLTTHRYDIGYQTGTCGWM